MSQVISWGFLHQKSSAAHAKDVEFLTSIASGQIIFHAVYTLPIKMIYEEK